MGPRRWCGVAFFVLLASWCVAAQQSDPWNPGGSSNGASGVSLGPAGDVPSASRSAGEGRNLEFKSQPTLVEVPVVVTDKAGAHVHQLTQADFKILEDGKEQRIASLEEITAANDPLSVRANAPGTFSNLRLQGQQPHSVTVIVLDMVNTPFLDQSYARGQVIKYLADNLSSKQVLGLMVIGNKGLKVLSGLTTDPAALIATLKKVSGEVSAMEKYPISAQATAATGDPPSGLLGGISPGEEPGAVFARFLREDAVEATYQQGQVIETTLRAFLSLAWSLSGVPGRKSVVWMTGSFPFYLDSYASVPGDDALRALY